MFPSATSSGPLRKELCAEEQRETVSRASFSRVSREAAREPITENRSAATRELEEEREREYGSTRSRAQHREKNRSRKLSVTNDDDGSILGRVRADRYGLGHDHTILFFALRAG